MLCPWVQIKLCQQPENNCVQIPSKWSTENSTAEKHQQIDLHCHLKSYICINHLEEKFILREDVLKLPSGKVVILPRKKLALTEEAYHDILPSFKINQPICPKSFLKRGKGWVMVIDRSWLIIFPTLNWNLYWVDFSSYVYFSSKSFQCTFHTCEGITVIFKLFFYCSIIIQNCKRFAIEWKSYSVKFIDISLVIPTGEKQKKKAGANRWAVHDGFYELWFHSEFHFILEWIWRKVGKQRMDLQKEWELCNIFPDWL